MVTEKNGLIFNDTLSQFISDGRPIPFQKQLFEQCLGGLNEPLEKEYVPVSLPEESEILKHSEPDDEPEL